MLAFACAGKQSGHLACLRKQLGVRYGKNARKPCRRTVMAKKAENPTPHSHEQTLGQFLRSHRQARRLTLREVEEASGVSNPYLSQLENDKIAEPSPPILHKLAPAYGVPYETLMEKAGYLSKKPEKAPEGAKRRGGLAAFAKDELTPEEEEALVEYLAFLRSRKPKK